MKYFIFAIIITSSGVSTVALSARPEDELVSAIRGYELDRAKQLFAEGSIDPDFEVKDNGKGEPRPGQTILFLAALYENWDLVKQMLEKNPNANTKAGPSVGPNQGKTIRSVAASYKQWALVANMLNWSNRIIDPELKQDLMLQGPKSDKLLLCAGNPDPKDLQELYPYYTYTQNNENWFTIDIDPVMRPDYLADLKAEQTYAKLSENRFEIIVDEYCFYDVSDEIHRRAAALLRPRGILVSKVCAPYEDLNGFKQEMLGRGFSTIIFADSRHLIKLPQYWYKAVNNEQIVSWYKSHESNSKNFDSCVRDNSQWYVFIGIRGGHGYDE